MKAKRIKDSAWGIPTFRGQAEDKEAARERSAKDVEGIHEWILQTRGESRSGKRGRRGSPAVLMERG